MQIGDEVEWTVSKCTSRSCSFSQRYGKILELLPEDRARVKSKNGKIGTIALSRLHICGNGPNQLTRLIYESGSR